MVIVKKTLIWLGVILLSLILIGWLLPAEFKVQRSIIIKAPAQKIFPHIVNLKNWQNWGVWYKRDPNMVLQYSGIDGSVGMRSQWFSESQGNGEMMIVALEKNKRVIYSLSFADLNMVSTGELVLKKTETGTEVVWMDYGRAGLNPLNRYFAFFMDYLVGGDFEMGLDNLKIVSEAR